MKNRFYDAEDARRRLDAAMRTTYEPLLDYLVDEDELQTVMMMMIGELNASHTGVSGGPSDAGPSAGADALSGIRPRRRSVRLLQASDTSTRTARPTSDYLKIQDGRLHHRGRRPRPEDDRQLLAALHAAVRRTSSTSSLNDKPAKEGAWEVTIAPIAGGAFGDLQYARWVDDRRDMVDKLSNGEIGYLHIRAMDAPSLRQFQLDLAANRTKKALVIDQRFNGGGGIDQELLGDPRRPRSTNTRSAATRACSSRGPQNFYGPMVVMQNERSASDAEMFPAGFKALGLGKVIGVPTMGAVIGTGLLHAARRVGDSHAGQRRVD